MINILLSQDFLIGDLVYVTMEYTCKKAYGLIYKIDAYPEATIYHISTNDYSNPNLACFEWELALAC